MRKLKNAILFSSLALTLIISTSGNLVSAQEGERRPIPIANGDRVYCAGFISDTKINYDMRIIGSEREAERSIYTNGMRTFINKGRADGIQVGDTYQVIRPRGPFYHPFKNVKTFTRRGELLGYFTEEIGFVKVIGVQDKTATVEVTEACSEVRFGDALVKYEKPQLPELKAYAPIDPVAPANDKTKGQIVGAKGTREFLTISDVVLLDVGQKAGVKVGDYFTIFRENGSELIQKFRDDEVSFKKTEGGSDRYRGSSLSIEHPSIQKEKLRKEYPNKTLPRTIVGELVVTRVEGNTAVAIITRNQGSEVFIGDNIELQ
ncbi:MAG: hypothetical protein HY819_24695 [Acidobacteria bacterium]|nr:hypothetical protein [Acidobacteriota bacterium]